MDFQRAFGHQDSSYWQVVLEYEGADTFPMRSSHLTFLQQPFPVFQGTENPVVSCIPHQVCI